MFTINKKLGAFIFGCLFAASYIWLVSLGNSTLFLNLLSPSTGFTLAHYSGGITAFLALISSGILLIVMNKGFNICTSDHPFWLVLPSLYLLILTTFSAFELLYSMLYAAIPCLFVLAASALFYRFSRQRI